MKYYVTGDTHGHNFERIEQLNHDEEHALIILGDAGFNFYRNKTDEKNKKVIQNTGCIVYCVRGNHEERPENIEDIEEWYDSEIEGTVYRQPQYPNIRYLMDGHVYLFNNHPTLVLGGAYSVDKWFRLSVAPKGAKWTGWFKDEQLTIEEMEDISSRLAGKNFDFVLSHTCPKSWEPTDLFIGSVDQSTVDKTMEEWMEKFKDTIGWHVWLFGHYHDDRLVRPGVEMYFKDIEDLETIYTRWLPGQEIPWWIHKDPKFCCGTCKHFLNGGDFGTCCSKDYGLHYENNCCWQWEEKTYA